MSYEMIEYAVNNSVATITFNRPEVLNALNDQITHEATKAFKAAKRDGDVRAIILTGAGRGFSSGADLASGDLLKNAPDGKPPGAGDHLAKVYHPLIQQITSIEKPVIGAINGIAAGIGMSVALATDIRMVSDKAAFTLGFGKIGLVPDGGASWILPRLIGYNRAYQIYLSSEKVSAQTALDWGMVNQVVPHEQLMEVTLATATKLASGPTLAFGLAKRAMRQALDQSFTESLTTEIHLQNYAGKSHDFAEGVTAFFQKREPKYKGK